MCSMILDVQTTQSKRLGLNVRCYCYHCNFIKQNNPDEQECQDEGLKYFLFHNSFAACYTSSFCRKHFFSCEFYVHMCMQVWLTMQVCMSQRLMLACLPQSLSSALLRQSPSLNWKLVISARHAGQNALEQQDHIPIKNFNMGAKGMSSGARGMNSGPSASTSTSPTGPFLQLPREPHEQIFTFQRYSLEK